MSRSQVTPLDAAVDSAIHLSARGRSTRLYLAYSEVVSVLAWV